MSRQARKPTTRRRPDMCVCVCACVKYYTLKCFRLDMTLFKMSAGENKVRSQGILRHIIQWILKQHKRKWGNDLLFRGETWRSWD
jgi:hypothetical protein